MTRPGPRHHGPQRTARPPRAAVKVGDGWWPRFSRYEIVDGYIRPTADATLQRYELWVQPGKAHESLTNIIRQDVDRDAAILAWCREYGLLGVLLHRVERVTFPVSANDDGSQNQATLRRIPQGWQHGGTSSLGEPLNSVAPVGVTLHGLTTTDTSVEPIEAWTRFFPSIRTDGIDGAAFPHPNNPHDERFWRLYAEPLEDFISAAGVISDAMMTIAAARTDASPSDERRLDPPLQKIGRYDPLSDYAFAIAKLNACATSIRLFAQPQRDGTVTIRWRAHTLFASLALSALQNMASGRMPLLCPCGELFTTTAWQGRYCSTRCYWNFNKRKQRKEKKGQWRRRSRACPDRGGR